MLSFRPRPLTVVVVTFLLVFPWRIRANTLDAIPEKNVKVVSQKGFWMSHGTDVFSIVADMPVNVNRFDNTLYFYGGAPVEDGQVFLYVKTQDKKRCKDSGMVELTYGFGDDNLGGIANVTIRAGNRVRPDKFLKTSSAFDAKWSYTSGWCMALKEWERVEAEEEENNGGNRKNARRRRSESRLPIGTVAAGQQRRLQEEPPSTTKKTKRCKATVEIVMSHCISEVAVEVLAPKIRVKGFHTESDQTYVENKDNECRTDYGATISFPTRNQTMLKANDTAYLPPPSRWDCGRLIEGRPFVDSSSKPMVASSHVSDTATWAREVLATTVLQTTEVQPPAERMLNEKIASSSGNRTASSPSLKVASEDVPKNLIASTWTRRGLGEHASVASFAVFTLELMTNNAPPSLVRDALKAALDEVNHATTSFQVASLLAGANVEPGALPPSTHNFDRNLESLALSAAREGCIDETLSALAAALEADFYDVSDALLSDKLRGIARDEARHSALAWRTVRWVCSVDKNACDAVQSEAFSAAKLSSAVKRHPLPWGGSLDKEWKLIYETLVPLVVTGNGGNICNNDCGGDDAKEDQIFTSQEAAQEIIRAVVCDDGM